MNISGLSSRRQVVKPPVVFILNSLLDSGCYARLWGFWWIQVMQHTDIRHNKKHETSLKQLLTWGTERRTLIAQATLSIILFFFLALLMARGLRMADCLSRLMTTVTNAQEYIATSFRNISNLQARSPANHWTVMFQAASTGITMKVTSRSAMVRFMIKILTWDLRLLLVLAAHNTERLHTADTAQRVKVIITLTFAAMEKVGSCNAASPVLLLHVGKV